MDSPLPFSSATHCQQCALRSRCLPNHLESIDVSRFDAIVQRARPLRLGAHCFNAGEPFSSIYVVRQGAIKTYSMTEEGEELIDPDTGAVLDVEEGEEIGRLKISKVSEKVSYADVIEGEEDPAPGTAVTLR